MLVSNFRSFMDQEEDYRDEDYDLYGDEDYYTFDEDYYYQKLNLQNKYMMGKFKLCIDDLCFISHSSF